MSVGITASVLKRFIRPEEQDLSPEMARHIVNFSLSDDERAHLTGLAQKSDDGELTVNERSEYESLVILGEFLTLMKCKARIAIDRAPSTK